MSLSILEPAPCSLNDHIGKTSQESKVAKASIIQAPLSNLSLQVTTDHNLKQVGAPVYAPQKGEVLLHIKVTGICGSDIHFWKTGRIGSLVVEGDCILGHEAAGVVLQVGEGVTNLKPSDHVAMEPGVPCSDCFFCSDGRYNLWEDVQFAGVYPYHGSLQRYKIHPARWLHKLPDNVSFAAGALFEPLSVAMHGIRMAGIRMAGLPLGRGAVICGTGPVGLLTLAADRVSGAHPIVITDLEPSRLKVAEEFVPNVISINGSTETKPLQFELEAGSKFQLDASVTYDPDQNGTLTFKWYQHLDPSATQWSAEYEVGRLVISPLNDIGNIFEVTLPPPESAVLSSPVASRCQKANFGILF